MGKIEIEGTKMSFSWGPKVCFETAAGDFFSFPDKIINDLFKRHYTKTRRRFYDIIRGQTSMYFFNVKAIPPFLKLNMAKTM